MQLQENDLFSLFLMEMMRLQADPDIIVAGAVSTLSFP
jgi:hypothetical protein